MSWKNIIFELSGYKLERIDRNIHGGGLATFIRTDIPARRRHDLECQNLENIIYEVTKAITSRFLKLLYLIFCFSFAGVILLMTVLIML
jgi:hypothetical protein